MKKFIDENFLLKNEAAIALYHNYAKDMPIFDYHCHISVKEICEDKKYRNITEAWLSADHYKWRLMRLFGIEEEYITGRSSDFDKFKAYAKVISGAIGNPLYHWTHLELQRFFGITLPLNEETAEEIWEKTNRILAEGLTARQMILKSNVKALCSTDDPADDLKYHIQLREEGFPVNVMPTFRPDNLLDVGNPYFKEYISELSKVAEVKIEGIGGLIEAIVKRLDYFEEAGCRASDHGMAYFPYREATFEDAEHIFKKATNGGELTLEEKEKYKTFFMQLLAEEYYKRGMVMQLHMGPMRRVNTAMSRKIGPDAGFDSINDLCIAEPLGRLLDSINEKGMPKTVLYNLNPKDNEVLAAMTGNFTEGGMPGKVQFGSGWWFNDTKDGMERQIKCLGNLSLLSTFIGMLTDSRSFTSYVRFEYFRRILCNIIGTWMEEGEIPYHMEAMGKIVEDICYNNAVKYFGKN